MLTFNQLAEYLIWAALQPPAVDVNTILSAVMAGRGTVANGVVPPTLGGYDADRKGYPHDVAKAKQLLVGDTPYWAELK